MDRTRRDSEAFQSLTERERDVLALLAANLSDRAIADQLVLSRTTVKWYNRQIFNKLGVENRQQAVVRAYALGLLERTRGARSAIRNQPAALTPFIGRSRERDELSRLLGDPHVRLLTLLAPGGMGKTRLAVAAAEMVVAEFADGVCFVPLAPSTSSDSLVVRLADAVGLRLVAESRSPGRQLLDFLRTKQVLLVLDNGEYLLEDTALVAEILQASPGVKVFATSRERLKLEGETVHTLGGMRYPEQLPDKSLFDYEAVQLFVACARRANTRFVAHDEGSILRICQLTQGMPLAIEMAAAWVRVLSPGEIVTEMERGADFLRTSVKHMPKRLRSVRVVFETTWARLSDDERTCFSRLSVFRGGATREAAQTVTGASLNMLAALVDRALLWHRPDQDRYEVHELLRQYAATQLEMAGETEAIRAAHGAYFGKLAHTWAAALKTPQQLRALDMLEADFDNIREAFACAIATGAPEIIEPFTDLWYFYEIRARYVEAITTFQAAIRALPGQDSIALGKLLAGQSVFLGRLDRWEESHQSARMSVEMLRRLGAACETSLPLMQLGDALGKRGDREAGAALYRAGYAVALDCEDQWAEACLVFLLGAAAYQARQFDQARGYLTEAYELCARLGNVWGLGFPLHWLAALAYEAGDYAEAQRLYEECLVNARRIQHTLLVHEGLCGLMAIALARGDVQLAKGIGGEVLQLADTSGNPGKLFDASLALAELDTYAGSYDEARGHLREALKHFGEVDPGMIGNFGVVAAEWLFRIGLPEQAARLVSFLRHQPERTLLSYGESQKLDVLAKRLKSEMLADSFDSAWEQGRDLTLDQLVTSLRRLI